MIKKTIKQIKTSQAQAQKTADHLNQEVIVIAQNKQHIQVQAGKAYQLSAKDFNTKKASLIAKKVGNDLEISLENNVVVFDDYFEICATDLSCLVSLPTKNGGLYHVLADTFFTLEDGTQIVYFYGEQSIVSTESSTGDKQSFFDIITPDMELVAAVAVLAVVISGNSDGDDSDGNDDGDDDVTNKSVAVIITSNKLNDANDAFKLTFTFTEQVSGFDRNDITFIGAGDNDENIDKGTLTTASSGADHNKVFTLIVTPKIALTGNIAVNIAANAATGIILEKANIAATKFTQKFDDTTPESLALVTTDDMGISNSDNITNKTIVTIIGKAQANSTIELFNVFNSLGTTTADDSGNFSKKVTLAENTTTDITAKATDADGNTSSASSVLSVSVDTTKPTFTSSNEGMGVVNRFNAVYNAEVNGDEASVTYTLRAVDLNKFNINAESGVVTYKITPNVVPATPDNIVITATNIAGNTETHNVVITMVIKLAVTITSNKLNGANGAFKLTFTFTEQVSGFELGDIIFTGAGDNDENINKGTLTTASSGAYHNKVFTLIVTPKTTLTEGNITVDIAADVVASATSNRVNIAAIPFTQKFDKIAPIAPENLALVTTDDTGISNSDNITSKTTITIIGKAEAGTVIKLFNGLTLLGETIADDNGNFSNKITLAENAITNITAKAIDVVGNTSSTSSVLSVSVDITKPTFTSSNKGVGITNQPNAVYNAEVDGDEASVTYTLRAVDLNKFNINAGSGIVTYKTIPNVVTTTPDNIVITATDIAGNTETHNVAIIAMDKLAVTITSNKPNGTDGVFELTFTFTEKVTGFDINDIDFGSVGANDVNISKGILTTANSGDDQNKVFNLVVTPEPELEDSNISIDIAANTVTGLISGQKNIAITQFIQVFDDTVPTLALDNPWILNFPSSGYFFEKDDVVTLTLTFSEALVLSNTIGSKIMIADKAFMLDKNTSIAAGNTKLVFAYTVKEGDNISSADFDIDNPVTDIILNNITDVIGNAPAFATNTMELGSLLKFFKQTGTNNPLSGVNVQQKSTPTFADIDGDGKADLVVGNISGSISYYKNTSTNANANPVYTTQTGDANPFNNIDVGYDSAPTFVDLNNDGKLELLVSEYNGGLYYYKNTGTIDNPVYTQQADNNNPFHFIQLQNYNQITPVFADINGDNKQDLIMGMLNGSIKYYQNIGTYSNPIYTEKTDSNNPFNDINVGTRAKPTFADINGDGKLDLVVGETDNNLNYYQNTGAFANPVYTKKTGNNNPFNGIDMGLTSAPAFYDIDGDGDLDLVAGEYRGKLHYYRNQMSIIVDTTFPTPINNNPWLLNSPPSRQPDFKVGDIISLTLTLNEALVLGDTTGSKVMIASKIFMLNKGASTTAGNTKLIFTYTVKAGDNINPTDFDIDNPANDITLNNITDIVGNAPAFDHNTVKLGSELFFVDTLPKPINNNPWTLNSLLGSSSYRVGDIIVLTLAIDQALALGNTTGSQVMIAGKAFILDKNASIAAGNSKLVFTYTVKGSDRINPFDFDIDNPINDITLNNITDATGNMLVFTNTTVELGNGFSKQTGVDNFFSGVNVRWYSTPNLIDVNGDHKVDLVVGDLLGGISYYKNTGTNANPVYTAQTGDANPFKNINAGGAPTFFFNFYSRLGLLVSEYHGNLYYYKNTGTNDNPIYTQQTYDSSPFRNIQLQNFTRITPVFADINSDGKLELMIGMLDGSIKYYQDSTESYHNTIYTEKTGSNNPFDGIDVGTRAKPTFADINGDGKLDLVVGETDNNLNYYQNTGTFSNPVYTKKTGSNDPFNGIDVGLTSTPTFHDIDGDGDLDLVAGENHGKLNYYLNQTVSVKESFRGFVINGENVNDVSGTAATAGDVNGDGLDDLIVSARRADPSGKSGAGKSYVIFGKTDNTAINLSAIASGTGGFVINGENTNDFSGYSVSTAGDVNGDGLDDLIVGAIYADPSGKLSAGKSYVIFGKANNTAINLSAIASGTGGFVINGENAGDENGYSVSTAGDVNGDGLDDLIVSARRADPSGKLSAGKSYVIFGKTDNTAINLSAIASGTGGFIINGENAYGENGYSVSTAGDVNGDGLDDLIVGAPYVASNGKEDAGRSYVIFGKTDNTAINLPAIGTGGFVINGENADDESGTSVSTAGDVNGDGLDDLIVSARRADPSGKLSAGKSYVIFGKTDNTAINLSAIASGTGGFIINGENTNDFSSWSVSTAGDVNGDGLDDLIVGAPFAGSSGKFSTGKSYVVFGKADNTAINLSAIASGTGGFVIIGENAGDVSGASVSTAGDVNGDGLDDLIVGALDATPSGKADAGISYVIFGKTDTDAINLTNLGGNSKYAIDYLGDKNANTFTGTSSDEIFVAGAGDDTLIGNGGMDVLNAGAGNDTIAINASNIAALAQTGTGNRARVDGGGNTDTLKLDGSDLTLNLTNISNTRIQDIEKINITGSGSNTLILNLNDVLDTSTSTNILKVLGNSDDTVNASGFVKALGAETEGSITYDVYTHSVANTDAKAALWIQQDVGSVIL